MDELKLKQFYLWAYSSEQKRKPIIMSDLLDTRDIAISEIAAELSRSEQADSDTVYRQLLHLNAYGYTDVVDLINPGKRLYLMKCEPTKGIPVKLFDELLARGE